MPTVKRNNLMPGLIFYKQLTDDLEFSGRLTYGEKKIPVTIDFSAGIFIYIRFEYLRKILTALFSPNAQNEGSTRVYFPETFLQS